MLSRTPKRFIIGSVYVLIIVVITGGFYWGKYQPTCNDGIKNGQEEGVDCGTVACGKACASPIQALQIQDFSTAKTPVGDYDLAIQIYNPNINYGVVEGIYNFDDGQSGSRANSDQKFYMLPGQTKYLVLSGLPNDIKNVDIQRVDWQKVTPGQDVTFIIAREVTTSGANQTTYQAVITNNTNFDFDTIDVSMVVTDSSGAIIATNMTNFQTFLSHTDRSIKVTWPFVLPADARVHTEVNTNVFNNSNFLKTNGTQEKFQQYY